MRRYVISGDDNLYDFDASGTTNCSGTPKVCAPLWTAPTFGGLCSPTVVNGVVYTGGEFVSAFDANGTTNCSGTPKVCMPLWTSAFPFPTFNSSPSVANGLVYASGEDDKATAGAFMNSSPAVANGVVYAGSSDLEAFDAGGNVNCGGTPKVCTPLWTAAAGVYDSSPSVAGGLVFIGRFAGGGHVNFGVEAYDAAGTLECSGTPKVCGPLWTGVTATPVLSSPTVADRRRRPDLRR